tara:strand:- start:605 stop:787 length:183 start_codon:yes stop_codon:yes gene_type:complete
MDELRAKRDFLLTMSDFYASVSDYPMTDAERVAVLQYRQELRDMPLHPERPFPEKPDIIK